MGASSTTNREPVHAEGSLDENNPRKLESEDAKLLDYVTTVLVDPNLHTDLAMRLHEEISELLRATHEHAYGAAVRHVDGGGEQEATGDVTREQATITDDPRVAKLLRAMLVDPNLHTDMRMRLHDQIPKLVETARGHRATRTE